MSSSWHRLSIPTDNTISVKGLETISGWISSVDNDLPGGRWKIYDQDAISFLTESFYQRLISLGLNDIQLECFYRKSQYQHPTAHIDGSNIKKPICAINWVITNDDDSKMVWYNTPDMIDSSIKNYGATYHDIDITGLDIIDEVTIGNRMTLVRVDIPHNIKMGNNCRFVISIRFNINSVLSWNHAVDYFAGLISDE
jgi:hypothetical protein